MIAVPKRSFQSQLQIMWSCPRLQLQIMWSQNGADFSPGGFRFQSSTLRGLLRERLSRTTCARPALILPAFSSMPLENHRLRAKRLCQQLSVLCGPFSETTPETTTGLGLRPLVQIRQNVSFCPMLRCNITRKPLIRHGPQNPNMGQKDGLDFRSLPTYRFF